MLVWVHRFNVKTVLFQTIQFSINMQFRPVWPIDKNLSGATTPGQGGHGRDGNERASVFPKIPALMELQYQMV